MRTRLARLAWLACAGAAAGTTGCKGGASQPPAPQVASSAEGTASARSIAPPEASQSAGGPGKAAPATTATKPDSRRPLRFAERHQAGVLSVAFVPPDGARALSSGVDDLALVWDTRSGTAIHRYPGKTFRFQSVAFSRDGARALTAGEPANYWQIETGTVIRALSGQRLGVSTVALAPDEHTAVTAGHDGSVVIWDLDAGTPARRIDDAGAVLSIGYSKDSRSVTWIADDTDMCRVDVKGRGPPSCLKLDAGNIDLADVHEDASLTGNRYGELALWSASGRKINAWEGHDHNIDSIDFSPVLALAASTSEDHVVRLWRTNDAKMLGERKTNSGVGVVVALSPDGSRVLLGGGDGTVTLSTIP
jgi:WD40 repeat protein